MIARMKGRVDDVGTRGTSGYGRKLNRGARLVRNAYTRPSTDLIFARTLKRGRTGWVHLVPAHAETVGQTEKEEFEEENEVGDQGAMRMCKDAQEGNM